MLGSGPTSPTDFGGMRKMGPKYMMKGGPVASDLFPCAMHNCFRVRVLLLVGAYGSILQLACHSPLCYLYCATHALSLPSFPFFLFFYFFYFYFLNFHNAHS